MGKETPTEYLQRSANVTDAVSSDLSEHEVAIIGVDFRRGELGEGKVIINLSDPAVNIDVNQTADNIKVEFLNAQLPANLRRTLDVIDFATPVTQIDTDFDGSKTTLDISVEGPHDYLAYQADDTYVISIKPLTAEELAEKQAKFAFSGDKLSLNFQNIEVRSVLQLIADFTDLNLVASDTVRGSITLRLDNVPWDQALDLVLKTKGLDKRVIGNVMMVGPAAEIAERERQQLETQRQLEELAPVYTEYIRVRYASAKELFKLFGGEGKDGATQSILSGRGSAIIDERTNSIILTDTADKIAEFKKLIDQVDIPIRQVMIEARIVIANTDYQKELGVSWGAVGVDTLDGGLAFAGSHDALDSAPGSPYELFPRTNGSKGVSRRAYDRAVDEAIANGGSASDVDIDSLPQESYGSTDLTENLMVDLGVANPAGSLAMSFLNDNVLLSMEISALQDSGNAEIVSQPKVITGDKQTAHIQSGTQIPYQEASSSGATSTSFKEAVLSLEVTPQITPDDQIIMDLKVNQDSVGQIVTNGVPTIDVTELQTQVLVSNGQTIVLGGIFQTEQVKGETKVPMLGDLPYLGRLFRKDVQSENKRELLIFITPKILSNALVQ